MSDAGEVHIGENSPEQVAFKLMQTVASAEKKIWTGPNVNTDRDWIIRTYCMCLMAVKQYGYPEDALKVGAKAGQ